MMSNMLGQINLSLQVRIIMCILVQSLALKPKREYMCGIAHPAAFVQWMKCEKRHNHIHCVEEWFGQYFLKWPMATQAKTIVDPLWQRIEETTRTRHREMLGKKNLSITSNIKASSQRNIKPLLSLPTLSSCIYLSLTLINGFMCRDSKILCW